MGIYYSQLASKKLYWYKEYIEKDHINTFQVLYYNAQSGAYFKETKVLIKETHWTFPYYNYEDIIVVSTRLITAKPLPIKGGCDSKEQTLNYQIVDAEGAVINEIRVKSMKSKNNNCAIACFKTALNRKDKADNIRKQLNIELETLLTIY